MRKDDLESAVAALALTHRLLDPAEAVRLIYVARTEGASLAQMLLETVPQADLLKAVAHELGLGFVDLYATSNGYRVDDELVGLCDVALLKENHALPLRAPGERVSVAMANPRNTDMLEYLRGVLPEPPLVVLAEAKQIQSKLVYFDAGSFGDGEGSDSGARGLEGVATAAPPTQVEDNPVVDWVDNLLARAAAEGASDVEFLFEYDGTLLVRFRIDSKWRPQPVPLRNREREIVGTLLSKCATIDASDRTRPQDGTFSFTAVDGRNIDTRLAMLPQAHGPTVVVRLLDPANINRKLDDMGFAPNVLDQMRRAINAPQGAVFFIGPTGSGKTTTMYGLLKELDALSLNILTAEEPIEYRLPHIGQTQIRSDLGEKSLTFAKAMKSFLRCAPDVILVGEIRDEITAETAMHAAMSGHRVLSTIHAKSALSVYQRLDGLGVDPFLAAESLSLAVNQRLLRVLHDCATEGAPTRGEVAFLHRMELEVPDRVRHVNKSGCGGCGGTGFRGRVAVVEVLEPNDAVRTMVQEQRPYTEIEKEARREGYTSIMSDAFRHVLEGRTPVSELVRAIDTRSK